MKYSLTEITNANASLNLAQLPVERKTVKICLTGQDGSGKTTAMQGLADYLSEKGKVVITAKSPCDKHTVDILNNAISQDDYKDWYTEQLLFSYMDGVLSNYMMQLDGHCDYFICQRGPIDQYAHGVTRSCRSYSEIHDNQRPERLAKFDMYIHFNCIAEIAWERLRDDDNKDRYEYPEYFRKQVENTRKLYDDIVHGKQMALNFFRLSRHVYLDTSYLTIPEVLKQVIDIADGYFG